MNKSFHCWMGGVWIFLLLLLSFTLHGQQRNLKTEVLVYIFPDSLELPKSIREATTLTNASIRSSALGRALTETKVASINRAFPDELQ